MKRLSSRLSLSPTQCSGALRRLMDEHIVRESRSGVVGGLHQLRSVALSDASHDEVIFLAEDSLWLGIVATTSDSLPRVVRSIISGIEEDKSSGILAHLAEILGESPDVGVWSGILIGLGLATLERNAAAFIEELQSQGLDRAFWSLAALFFAAQTDVPDLPNQENFGKIRRAVDNFKAQFQTDLRLTCLRQVQGQVALPPCSNLREVNHLLSCFAPLSGCSPLPVNVDFDLPNCESSPIEEVATLLSTAYFVGKEFAESLAAKFGGEETLLNLYWSQTPWLEQPVIEVENGERVVRANWFFASERFQPSPHDFTCRVCENLIALSPSSEFAASDAIAASGNPISHGDYTPLSKRMPRKNIPLKARVTWGGAFHEMVKARANIGSLTVYAGKTSDLISKTANIFSQVTEYWVGGNPRFSAEVAARQINEVLALVNNLAYSEAGQDISRIVSHDAVRNREDRSGSLVSSVLGNLVPRLNKVPDDGSTRSVATFAGQLSEQAEELLHADLWRTVEEPPVDELKHLSKRLEDVCSIVHEIAFDSSDGAILKIGKAAKKGQKGHRLATAARHCRSLANARLKRQMELVERVIRSRGMRAKCWTQSIENRASPYWPRRELAILVDMGSQGVPLVEMLESASKHLLGKWPCVLAPVINGKVVDSLAIQPSTSSGVLPVPDFEKCWAHAIKRPFSPRHLLNAFESVTQSCVEVSAINNRRDLENLREDEQRVFENVARSCAEAFETFASVAAERSEGALLAASVEFIKNSWSEVVDEIKSKRSGQRVAEPLCIRAVQPTSDWSQSYIEAKGSIVLFDCGMLAVLLAQADSRE